MCVPSVRDPQLGRALAGLYNEWAAEMVADGGGRLPAAAVVPIEHGAAALDVLRRAKDLRVVFWLLAAPVHWWRLGLGVARPLRVGNLGIDLAVGQGVDATRRDCLLDGARRDSALSGVRPLAHYWHVFIPEISPCLPGPPE